MSGSDPEIDRLIGATVAGKYRIDGLLGRGGMGAVYQALNLAISKRVALKFLDREAARDAGAVRRFQREAEAASAVESTHIVEIFDSGTSDDGRPFLVMELLRGEDLRCLLRREGRLDLPVALSIATQMLRALARAHRAGIVHRDLKPDNVFLCERDDQSLFVKVVDFGISKLGKTTVDTLTRRGTVLGTVFYMSPEQAQAVADIDGRADLYSLGAILYEALSGRPPHTGRVYEAVLVSICTKDADDIRLHAPDVPEPVARIIGKALSRDRDERFRDADQFLEALLAVAPESKALFGSHSQHRMPEGSLGPDPAPTENSTAELRAEKSARLAAGAASGWVRGRRRLIGLALSGIFTAAFAVAFLSSRAGSQRAPEPLSTDITTEPPQARPATATDADVVSAVDAGVLVDSATAHDRATPEQSAPAVSAAAVGADPSPAPAVRTPGRSKTKRPAAGGEASTSGDKKPASGVLGGLELNTQGP